MSSLLILGNPMMANAQQTKTTTAESISTAKNISTTENISTDSIQAMKEKLRQDSIQWEKQLAAVTIKGTRSQFRQKNGGIVARISGTSLEKEPTATEVLAKLPGMFKNKDGKPQAFIGGAPEIYINDRKVQDYSVVENLPVTQIKEVKVIHHPGAEYGNNVGCVLLITTKKNLQGLAIVENSGFLFDSKVSNNHDLDLTYTRGKITYYAKLGYTNWQGKWKEQDITTNYVSGSQTGNNTGNNAGDNATNYIASSTLDCKHSYNDHFYWSAGADLALTEKQTIGVKYDGYNIHQPMPFKMTSYAMTNDHVDDNVTGNNKFLYYDWQHHVNAFYQGNYGEKWKLNIFGDFVKLHTEQGQFVDEVSEREAASTQQEARNKFTLLPQSDGTIWGAKARANYTINDKQTWMMGAEYNYVKSESRTDYTPADKGTSTHSITKENHAAVFAEYSLDFKPFSLRIGLRYEHVDSRLDSHAPLHRKYDNLYPSLLLSHQAGRFSQSLSYRSSETRPSFQELNTGTVYANRYMRQVGNSQLEPSQRHELQYQASYGDLFLQASYTYVKDYITSIIEPDSDDPQTGYITWTNIDHCWNWGSFLGYRHRWGFYEPQLQAGRHPAGLHQGRQHGQGEKLPRPLLHLQPLQRLPSSKGLVPEPLVLLPKQRHLRFPHHLQRAQLRLPALQEFPERPPLAKPERKRHLQHQAPKDRWHLRQCAVPAAEVGRHPKRAAPPHLPLQPGKEAIPWRELCPGSRGKNGRKIEKLSRFKYRKTKSLLSRISMILPQQRLFFKKGYIFVDMLAYLLRISYICSEILA